MKLSIVGVKVEEEMSRIFFSKGEISFQGLWGVLYLLLYRSHCWLKFLNSFVKTVGNFYWVFFTTKTFLSWTTFAVWPTFWPLQLCWCYLKFSISNHCFYLLKKAKTQILSLKFIPMYISLFIVCIEFYQKSFAEANIDKSSSLATEGL